MKKLFLFVLALLSMFSLTGCNSIKEYKGTKITKLTFSTVEYMGGYTVIRELDFNKNTYSSIGYLPYEDENPELKIKNTFTDDEEKIFMDYCYSYGLFNLKESYKAYGIDDGGGWDLTINYEDGTSKTSKGENASPTNIFNNCSTVFYDLCGEEVLGRLPNHYITPPDISYSFNYKTENTDVSTNNIARVVRANYKWNKNESLDNDCYLLNEANKDKNEFYNDYNYQLTLYTANYDCEEKFNKITVKEYDYNSDLSNEKIIHTGNWFKQIELDIELNKIYVYELAFKDGDYVQYTFSTYCD